ncbi:MAG: branched-chain amino acid ABC transporter permease [Chloroflexi bacterium]|nr:branched-chain amino acid ABC transporter permease [Chloroflexota bacterium]
MSAAATTSKARQNPAFGLRRNGQTPDGVVRNAVLVTFIIFLALYPIIDRGLGLQKMGAVPGILIFTILALGLNIVVGFAGLLDLGYAAFFAIGGYTAAFLTSPTSPLAPYFQTNFYVAMILSFFVAALFGVILGAPTLRLRGDYLAIVTLAFGEIVPRVILNLEQWTKGARGMKAIGVPTLPTVQNGQVGLYEIYNQNQTEWYYLIFTVGAISVFAIYRLAHSRIGRAWMAMREDELAAGAMGINLVQTKLLAFAIGASFSGFAGSIWASMLQFIDPFQFDFSISVIVLAMVILGGIGNTWGVIFGGAVLGFYDRILTSDATSWLRGIGAAVDLPVISSVLKEIDLTNFKFGIFGAALVILMLTRPEGLFPNRARALEMKGEAGPEAGDAITTEERTAAGARA